MKQTLKDTMALVGADVRARSEVEEQSLTFLRACRYMLKSAVMPIVLFRWQVFFYQHHMGLISSLLALISNVLFTVKIDSEAEIGSGLVIYHCSYVLIGRYVRMGKNCQLANQNTIMASSFYSAETNQSATGPIIGDGLLLGCGASVVGNITLGNNVQVSMNSTVDDSFPDNAILIGVPARNVAKSAVAKSE